MDRKELLLDLLMPNHSLWKSWRRRRRLIRKLLNSKLSLEVEFFRKSKAKIVSKLMKFFNLTTVTNKIKNNSFPKSKRILS